MKALSTVLLNRDLPEHGLRQGDVGAVVEVVYRESGIEVEFVTGSGHTQALVTLDPGNVPPFAPSDLLGARSLDAA